MRRPAGADNPPLERTAAAVYFHCRPSVARAPPRPLNGITLYGKERAVEKLRGHVSTQSPAKKMQTGCHTRLPRVSNR